MMTSPCGCRVEIKDVRLPQQLQRAMAAEAEATREARAKVTRMIMMMMVMMMIMMMMARWWRRRVSTSPARRWRTRRRSSGSPPPRCSSDTCR